MGPLKSPEIYEWEITNPGQELLLMCCDGFFSKNAFRSPQHLVAFLVNPMDYCHRSDYFHGERVEGEGEGEGRKARTEVCAAVVCTIYSLYPPIV